MKNSLVGVLLILAVLVSGTVGYVLSASGSNGTTNQLPSTTTMVVTSTVNATISSTPTEIFFYAPRVTIPVTCCWSLPTNFVVGDPNGNIYGFNLTIGDTTKVIGNGSAVTFIEGGPLLALEVYTPFPPAYNPKPVPEKIQWANFTWGPTFNEVVPDPNNATVFGGDVRMNWFVNSSVLYLDIGTK